MKKNKLVGELGVAAEDAGGVGEDTLVDTLVVGRGIAVLGDIGHHNNFAGVDIGLEERVQPQRVLGD